MKIVLDFENLLITTRATSISVLCNLALILSDKEKSLFLPGHRVRDWKIK